MPRSCETQGYHGLKVGTKATIGRCPALDEPQCLFGRPRLHHIGSETHQHVGGAHAHQLLVVDQECGAAAQALERSCARLLLLPITVALIGKHSLITVP